MSVLDQIVNPAFRLANVMQAPGRAKAAEWNAEALDILNALIDDLNTQRLVVYTIQRILQPLRAGQQTYQIGLTSPDWNIPRPSRVENASLIYQSGSDQPLELPITIIDTEQWQDIPVKNIASPVPRCLYYDRAYPLGNVSLWPLPSVSYQIALYLWLQLSQFGSLSDPVSLPPGYLRMLQYNLAVELEPRYPRTEMRPSVWTIAEATKEHIKSLNSLPLELDCDAGLLRYPWGSYGGLIGAIGTGGGGGGGGDVQTISITGTINGTNGSDGNPSFTLSIAPSFLQLFKNGLLQTPNVSYTLAGNMITFLADQIPIVGDVLLAVGRV